MSSIPPTSSNPPPINPYPQIPNPSASLNPFAATYPAPPQLVPYWFPVPYFPPFYAQPQWQFPYFPPSMPPLIAHPPAAPLPIPPVDDDIPELPDLTDFLPPWRKKSWSTMEIIVLLRLTQGKDPLMIDWSLVQKHVPNYSEGECQNEWARLRRFGISTVKEYRSKGPISRLAQQLPVPMPMPVPVPVPTLMPVPMPVPVAVSVNMEPSLATDKKTDKASKSHEESVVISWSDEESVVQDASALIRSERVESELDETDQLKLNEENFISSILKT